MGAGRGGPRGGDGRRAGDPEAGGTTGMTDRQDAVTTQRTDSVQTLQNRMPSRSPLSRQRRWGCLNVTWTDTLRGWPQHNISLEEIPRWGGLHGDLMQRQSLHWGWKERGPKCGEAQLPPTHSRSGVHRDAGSSSRS